jgi:hypothetical protein
MKVNQVDTWVATMADKPGGLAAKLQALAQGGANLELVIARRAPERPGKGVVFVTPIKGGSAMRAAKKAGFARAKSMHAIRIEGPDRKGQGSRIASALAEAGINLRGLSAAAIGKTFVCHIAVDTSAMVRKATKILKAL